MFCYLEISIFSKLRNQIMMIKNYIKGKNHNKSAVYRSENDGEKNPKSVFHSSMIIHCIHLSRT